MSLLLMEESAEYICETLPELTTELLSAYTAQSSEIQLKEDHLLCLNSDLADLQVQLLAVSEDVCTTVRTICLREDLLAELGRQCERLQREVLGLVQERQDLKLSLQKVKKENKSLEKMQTSYESKMRCHESKTKELEKLSSTQIELKALEEKIGALRTKREDYFNTTSMSDVLSGEKQQCLQDEVASVEVSREALSQDNTLLEEKLADNSDTIKSLKKGMETGRKRQAAQLKCLQRLVNETQAQRRQWAKKAEGLRANIYQIKQRIGDSN